jgi:multidrug resistance efflux pump
MASDRRRPKDLSAPSATVVAGTPKRLERGRITSPLGGRRKSMPASQCVDVAAPPEPQKGMEPTSPGGMPNAYEALTARRAGLWETVVGVGPFRRDRTPRAALMPRAEPAKDARRAGAPLDPLASAAASAPLDALPSAAAPSALPSDAALSAATQASPGTPRSPARSSAAASAAPPRSDADGSVRVLPSRSPAPSPSEHRDAARSDAGDRDAQRADAQRSDARPRSAPGLFRKAAVDARRTEAAEVDFLAGFKPKGWSVLLLLASLVGLLFVGAALAKVEVNAEAQGMLRAPRGLRPVASVLGGSISEVLVQSGDQVQQGQVVARLEATELRAALVNRERELATTEREVSEADRRDRQIEERASLAMQRRRTALQGRVEINRERLVQRRQQSDNYAELVREGGASQDQSLVVKEALQAASENVAALSAELAQLDLEIADRARQWQERDTTRRSQLSRAQANVEEARTVLASTEIKAPASGQIESVLSSPGNVVEAGGLFGNIVPSGAPRTIVAFVPSKDIAFVTPGASATVEVQSLPISEFGLGKGVVTRVSSDVATPTEVQATLGETLQGTVVRVELELTDSESSALMDPHLRSGDRVTIRLHRRERRVITLLFDFVRKWVS